MNFTPHPTNITPKKETFTTITVTTSSSTVPTGSGSSTAVPSGGGTEIDIPNSEAADRKKAGEDVHCVSDGDWAGEEPTTVWCGHNCFAPVYYCPESHCRCIIRTSGGNK